MCIVYWSGCRVVFVAQCVLWPSKHALKAVSGLSALAFSCAGADGGLFENVSTAGCPQPTEVEDEHNHCCVFAALFWGGDPYQPFHTSLHCSLPGCESVLL